MVVEHDPFWESKEFSQSFQVISEILQKYVEKTHQQVINASNVKNISHIQQTLEPEKWIAEGGLQGNRLAEWLNNYLEYSARLHHPRYMCHQVAPPAIPSALADFIHGSINNPAAIYEMGPSVLALEHICISWMLKKIGWKPEPLQITGEAHGAGVLTHGGSLANLTALLAARAAIAPNAWREGNPGNIKVLVPQSSHYSVVRTLAIMGLGEQSAVFMECDAWGRVDTNKLADTLQIVQQDYQVMAVVANACSTGPGLFDDLEAMGDICQQFGVWLHVDACHGGGYLTSDNYAYLLKGIEKADSVVWDAHKMMRVSALCAAVLFKNAKDLQAAFQQDASYLLFGNELRGIDSAPRTVECTKSGMATRLFLTLAWLGEKKLGEYIDAQTEKTQAFYHYLKQQHDFECPFEPECNILCFRFINKKLLEDLEVVNHRQVTIRESLMYDGEFHISSTLIGDVRYLRLTVMTPYTQLSDIQELVSVIRERWSVT
ncbi:MAG: pyridoxal-dependent decarboxylase [Pseudomonadota bacterium]